MTIYEVMYAFLEDLFPGSIVSTYSDILELTAFILTYLVVFGIILIPLYKLATVFLKGSRR